MAVQNKVFVTAYPTGISAVYDTDIFYSSVNLHLEMHRKETALNAKNVNFISCKMNTEGQNIIIL